MRSNIACVIFLFVLVYSFNTSLLSPSQTLPVHRTNINIHPEFKNYQLKIPVMYKRTHDGGVTATLPYQTFYRNRSFENRSSQRHSISNSTEYNSHYVGPNMPHLDHFWAKNSLQDLEFSSDHDYE